MNKQELENEEVRQEEKKTKKKKVRKKKTMFGHIRSIISILLVVGIIGGSYWYYAFQYRAEVEPETNRKVTNTDSVYTMEQYLKTLKRNQTVYKYACDEAEVDNDYGTYVVPGLKSTRTLKVKGDGEAEVCTSMTPQGLAFTEDYILVSAYCKTKAHDSVIYVIDKESRRFVKEIVLNTKAHVGGMAYDTMNQILWVTGQGSTWAQANAITLSHLENYSFDDGYHPIEFDMSYNLYKIKRASFMTYHDGALFVGFFTQDNASVIEKYLINADGTLYEKEDMNLKRTVGVTETLPMRSVCR